mmetsp:Transcript_26081/g.60913  ORF Transcript_26081/g.60913 Transcript_26081/m.60913 type:complete len:365 (+) Transcript_26081:3160-4254(+)
MRRRLTTHSLRATARNQRTHTARSAPSAASLWAIRNPPTTPLIRTARSSARRVSMGRRPWARRSPSRRPTSAAGSRSRRTRCRRGTASRPPRKTTRTDSTRGVHTSATPTGTTRSICLTTERRVRAEREGHARRRPRPLPPPIVAIGFLRPSSAAATTLAAPASSSAACAGTASACACAASACAGAASTCAGASSVCTGAVRWCCHYMCRCCQCMRWLLPRLASNLPIISAGTRSDPSSLAEGQCEAAAAWPRTRPGGKQTRTPSGTHAARCASEAASASAWPVARWRAAWRRVLGLGPFNYEFISTSSCWHLPRRCLCRRYGESEPRYSAARVVPRGCERDGGRMALATTRTPSTFRRDGLFL